MLEIQSLMEPGARHVLEIRQDEDEGAESPEPGDLPPVGSPRD